MKRISFITAILLTAAQAVLSQTPADALRYSSLDVGGTARYMGLSGAFGALGADFTTTSTNPAGIALFKSSEISITPAINVGTVESMYNGTSGLDQRSVFHLGNAGIVLASKLKTDPKKSGWRNVNFATGINRINNFNFSYEMTGTNTTNSLLDTYVAAANGIDFKDIEDDFYGDYAFDLNLAWWTYLLDFAYPGAVNEYISPIASESSKLQTKNVDATGSMNEYVFSLGANYNDRLYLGMTLGIPLIRYYETAIYTEENISNSDLKYFRIIDQLETSGTGFNFKLGFIYRASDWFRLGAAFHTPSWFSSMKDYWKVTMSSEFYTPDPDGYTLYKETSPTGSYTYKLQTPMRIQGSMAFIIGNLGLVSADYEFADYTTTRLDASDYSFSDENRAIRNSYTGAHQIRIGTEWRYSIFSFRAGGKYFTSPYQDNLNDGSTFGFSGGAGFRQGWFFMDLAYAYSNTKQDYYFYNIGGIASNPVNNTIRRHNVLLTVGVKL
ncbi:MAG: hypothetical protein K0B08_00565 [Bacteroidales bacterium]|nr:hypothetical protein [Bacteroidales bacterium]